MKRCKHLLLALSLALLCAPALAQVNPGTSPLSGAKGGTGNAFTQFAGPASSLKTYTLPNVNATLGALGVIQTWTAAQTFNATQTINPASATNTQGLVVNQTTPNSGTPTGPILLNTITLLDQGQNVLTSGLDSYGQQNSATAALRVSDRVSGGGGTHDGISVAVNITGSHGGAVGVQAGTYSNVNATGTTWSILGYSNVGASGVQGTMIALESEVLIATGGSATNRIGLNLNSQGPVAASAIDTAIAVDLLNNTLGAWAGPAAPFGNFVYFSNNLYGAAAQPIATTGSIFNSDAMTITNFANMANVAVTGNILSFPNLTIGGDGRAAFGSPTLPTSGIRTTCPSCGNTNIFSQTNGTTGADGLQVADSSGNNAVIVVVGEAGFTGTRLGQPIANWAELVASGTTNAGLMVGTLTNVPLVIGTNNAARLSISGAGVINANGNQLNNVIIGTSTPLAGTFTTFAANTSVSSPIHAASGAMTFQSNGSTYAGQITTGQQWEFGTNTAPPANAILTLNKNAAAPAASVVAQDLFHISSADATSSVMLFDGFGTATKEPFIVTRTARGTGASFTAVQSGDNIGFFGMVGATGANTFAAENGSAGGGFFGATATENWSATNQGTKITIFTTPNTTAGIVAAAIFQASGGLSIGTAADPGAQGIAATNYFAGATAGVTCSGTPTALFASIKGIVTHC